jgi:Zn-dependent peptidase ImmA (M78 family)
MSAGASPRPVGAAVRRPEEAAAERARSELGLGVEAPVADILAAVEDLAGIPVTVAELPDQIAGMYVRRRDSAFVFVNGIHIPVRQRFTVAHEFGHHVLGHRQRVDPVGDVFGAPKDPDEVAANYFAGAFLAPVAAVRNWADHHPEHPHDLEFVVRAGAFFGISAQTARIRLERAGVLRQAESRRLKEQITARAHHGMLGDLGVSQLTDELARLYRLGEFPRLPARMTAAARRAHRAGLIADEEFEEMLQGRTDLPADEDGDTFEMPASPHASRTGTERD